MSKKYWWKDNGVFGEGYYFLCHNENADYDCYIVDTSLAAFTRTNKELLGGARFVWGKHEGGLGYNLKPLRALTLEDAKNELEQIYLKMLIDRVAALNKEKEKAIDEKCDFYLYLEKKKTIQGGIGVAKENFVNGINFDNLTEQELRELNKASQEKLDAINAEKRRKAELKKNYALKEVPSTFKLDQARLGRSVVMWFKDHQEPLDSGTFNALVEGCTDEIKPRREEVYKCPHCGDFNLRVGNFGDTFAPRIAVTCESCDFTMKKKTDGKEYYAWEAFHEWLVKHGYLDESVKFDY